MRRGQMRVAAAILALAWVFVSTVAYYVVHKPFTAANVAALCTALAGLGGASLVAALGAGIGLLILQGRDLSPLERLVWACALGLGVVSLAGLGLGALGLLRPWPLWVLTAAGLGVTGRRLWLALRAAWAAPALRPRTRFEASLATYCGIMLAVALVWALVPPTAWDGLVYHLTGPKLYLAAGRVCHPLDLPYLGFPQLVEMLFAWGMALAGERAAAPIHWLFGLLAVLALVESGRRWFGVRAGWVAGAVLLSARSIVLLAGWPYVDLALLLYATLAFLALMRFCEEGWEALRWAILSGVLAGLGLSVKYTALALLPALAVALVVARIRNAGSRTQNLRTAIRSLLLVCGVGLAVWSPWLVKNLVLTGNPTYPFFFDGAYWDDWRAWWYDRPGTGLVYTSPWNLLTAPWEATIWGMEGAAGYGATIGPLFLALLPLLLVVWRRLAPGRRRWLASSLAFCGVIYGFWLWGVARTGLLRQTRLLFPAFGILGLVVGVSVERLQALPKRPLNLGWLTRAVLVGVLALTLVGTLLSAVEEEPLGVLLGFESREEFLARRLGWYYPAIEYVNRELPGQPVVLFLWEPRSYHCAVDCRPDALLDRFLHMIHLWGRDAEAIAGDWRSKGITHVLVHRAGLEHILQEQFDPLGPADVRVLEELQAHHLTPVKNFGSAYELYRLEEAR